MGRYQCIACEATFSRTYGLKRHLDYRHSIPLTATVGLTWTSPRPINRLSTETEAKRTDTDTEAVPLITPPDAPSELPANLDKDSRSSDSLPSDTLQPTDPYGPTQSVQEYCATDGRNSPEGPTPKHVRYDPLSVIWYAGHRHSTPSSTYVNNPSTPPTTSSLRESNKPPHDSIEAYLD